MHCGSLNCSQLGKASLPPAVTTTLCPPRLSSLHVRPSTKPLPSIQQHGRHIACRAADQAAEDSAAAAAATAAERRRLREERRSARQQDTPEIAEVSAQPPQEQHTEATLAAAQDPSSPSPAAAAASVDEASSTSEAAATARRPGSRLAARRQQRARQRGAQRRVPDPLVPEDIGDLEEDSSSEAEDDSDAEYDSDAEIDDDLDADESPAAAAVAVGGYADPDAASQQLPQSVLRQAAAQPGQKRAKQQQQGAGASSSTQQRQQKGQVQQRGGSRGAEGGDGDSQQPEPLELLESSPMYLPVLTDEDLEADPPGHKSGYVAVIGRPNAGKSTLINAIVGQKLSIVTHKPQTTRHRVVGIASDIDYQMILFDTPGIMQEQRSKLDERMMAAVVSSIKAAEVIIAVVDSGDSPQDALAMFQPGPDWSGPPMAVLLNKIDLLTEEQIQELQEWYMNNCRAEKVFVGSALEGTDAGVTAVKAWAVDKLPEGPTLYPKSMVSEQPERFFVSEIIREQIFVQYGQEIPYSCQVQVSDFKERRGAKDFIQAVVLVERETQAPIILGRGGSAIKKLGSAARQQIEDFLGRKVFLELTVQVAPAWRQQADKLKDFGYYDALYVS